MAQNARLKSENERLEKLQKETKQENMKLNEQIDEIMRNSKRKEGATWREINRLVDQVKMKYFVLETKNILGNGATAFDLESTFAGKKASSA